ncbi:hypothetical protein CK222_09705 [Mesorhizobium sp. WSM3866]|uniref:hypothetical protein n=1 Tax=Mesorhizobium sp. WSM3866 TaxID=422271 RepID=UPI000BB0B453|nr:hypothetical protein [Mesorhizobium sp. WSM3866]PBB44005.1 hypothetical protein CK222_09705 [Mesorhizobium sp. WSM3866]
MNEDTGDGELGDGPDEILAGRLAREADIAEEQARELMELNGIDWNALLREAHFLKARH